MERFNLSNQLKLVVNAAVSTASSSLTAISQLSEVDKFYWHFIASCCNHVQPNPDNLSKLDNYLFITERLSTIFYDYCTTRKRGKEVIHSIPQEIDRISNSDVKDYFRWIIKMQNIVAHWELKFVNLKFNYDDIFAYAANFQNIAAFAKAVYADRQVLNSDEIAKFKEDYSRIYAKLCSRLVKNDKEYGW